MYAKNETMSTPFTPPFVSFETRQIIIVSVAVVLAPVSIFGIVANSINIAVFAKQGFKDSMNISLLGLAVADLASLMVSLWASMGFNSFLLEVDLPFDLMDVTYMTGGYAHECFSRATSCITAFIALERCLCVIIPLKVKSIMTSARTKGIISVIFIFMIAIFSPFYFVNKLEWDFSTKWNRTKYILVFADNREVVETVIFLIHSVVLSNIFLISIIVCTVVLAIKLKRAAKWRQMTSNPESASKSGSASNKDKRVVKMVTLISAIFIVCFTPATLLLFVMGYFPEFSFGGKYENLFYVVWFIAYTLECINSSVNIFVYYTMSSKFKETYLHLFSRLRHDQQKQIL